MSAPRVLLVDDEPTVLRAARRALAPHFDVDTAASGEEALALLTQNAYDVLVTDHLMPGIHGVELLGRARAMHEGLAGVLVTGSAEHAARLDVRRFHTLIKPYDRTTLIETVERALAQGVRQRERTDVRARVQAFGTSLPTTPRKVT